MPTFQTRPAKIISYEAFVNLSQQYKWFKFGQWQQPNLVNSLFLTGWQLKYFRAYGLESGDIPVMFLGQEQFADESEYKTFQDVLKKKLATDEGIDFFHDIVDKQLPLYERAEKLAQIAANVNVKEPAKLKTALENLFDSVAALKPAFTIDFAISDVIEMALADRLKNLGIDGVDITQLLLEDTVSDTAALNNRVVVLANEIISGSLLGSSDEFKVRVKKLIPRFGYLGSGMLIGEGYNEDDLRDMVLASVKQIEASSADSQKDLRPARQEIRDRKASGLIKLLSALSHNRLRRIEVVNNAYFRIMPVLKAVAKEADLSYEQVTSLFVDEFLTLVGTDYKKVKSVASFAQAGLISKDKTYVISPQDLDRFVEEHFSESENEVEEVRGTTAYQGLVSGRVRIIRGPIDFSKFMLGEVLVCSMTDPNFVPLMQKAVAIVTDQGGVLCHAAIVSREMKKPCVIGTKNATKVLKDGDEVEVNADEGVVKLVHARA